MTSQINHGCVPNTIIVSDLEEETDLTYPFATLVDVRLMTLRPIAPGDEITVSYHNNCLAGRDWRRRANLNKLGFLCQCQHCVEAVEEETMSDIGTAVAGIFRGQQLGMYGRAYQRHCRSLLAAFHQIQLVGWHWKDWCSILAGAAEHMMTVPDQIRVYYFKRLELQWCQKWLGPSHLRTKDLTIMVARLRQMESVSHFANISWDFLTSESAQRVFFLEDSPPMDRLRGEDCVQALQELQTKERKQKKNLASKKNKARKKTNRPQDTDTAEGDPGQTAGPAGDATIPVNPSEAHPNDFSNDVGGSALSNEVIGAIPMLHSRPNSPTQNEGSEKFIPDDNPGQSATTGTQELEQEHETLAQDTTGTTVPAPAAVDDTTPQIQEMTSATGDLSISTAVAGPEAPPSHTGDPDPADDAISRTLSPNSAHSPGESAQKVSSQTAANSELPASPNVDPKDVELPVSPADETSSPASMTPVVNAESLDATQPPSEGSRQDITSPTIDIGGSHSIQASVTLSPDDNLSLDPVPAPKEVLQVASEDGQEDQPVDACPELEQVQSSSDEADDLNIPTPSESSADEIVPDQVAAPQEDTPEPDASARTFEPSKPQS